MRYVTSTLDLILARSPEEVIGAILLASLMSVVTATLYSLSRRKLGDPTMLLAGMMLLVSVTSMVLAAGYVARGMKDTAFPGPGTSFQSFDNPPPGGFGPGLTLAPQIMRLFDTDHDGRLSPREAAGAAEGLVREADLNKQGYLDVGGLSGAISRRMEVPPGSRPGGPPVVTQPIPAADPDRNGHLSSVEVALVCAERGHRRQRSGR
jgi:hypothetical protein